MTSAGYASEHEGVVMPVDTLLSASAELMVIGMGTVFIILGLMIGCMNLLRVFAPTEDHTTSCNDDKSIIAAIQTAIHHYRNRSSAHKSAL